MLRKIEYYLDHEDERMSIAEAGKKIVEDNHDLREYLKNMLKLATQQ